MYTGKGFFSSYDHVVPHIGFTARTKAITRQDLKNRKAPNPEYNYETESKKVIERVNELATNDTQKILTEFFDDKTKVDLAYLAAVGPLPPFRDYDNS